LAIPGCLFELTSAFSRADLITLDSYYQAADIKKIRKKPRKEAKD
jgi:hypothetical protein